jgi:predicted porin
MKAWREVMKKQWVIWGGLSLLANGALADVEVASGVKLYGVLDQAVQTQDLKDPNSTTAGQKYVGMFATGSTSRLGVKGQRELSNGAKAYIQVELELKPDKPKGGVINTSANRGTFVGLDGSAGTIRLGTQETMAYETFAMDANGRTEYKPQLWRLTQTKGDTNSQGDRAGNSVKYITPEIAGFTGHVLGAIGEGNTRYQSMAIKYQKDALKAVYVYDVTQNAKGKICTPGTNCMDGVANDGGTAGSSVTWGGSDTDDVFRNIAAASYDFGPAAINYIFARAHTTASGKAGSLSTHTVGLKLPLDHLTLALSYGLGTLDSYTAASAGSYAGDASLTDTTLGAYYAFDKATSAYFVGSVTTIGTQAVQSGSVKTANIGLQYKF